MKLRNLIIISTLLTGICGSVGLAKGTSIKPSIILNGVNYNTPVGEPDIYINIDGRAMVPVRFLSAALGVADDKEHIMWNQVKNQVTILKDSNSINVQVGNENLIVNSETIKMDTKAELIKDRVFIPLRYIAESLGARVEWDTGKNSIYIYSDVTNNFSRYNLASITAGFPVSLNGEGYTLKLKDLLIYPYESVEAKALISKYITQMPNGTPYYLVWMNVDITNTGEKEIGTDPTSSISPFSFGFSPADEDKIQPLQPKQEFDQMNNPEILYKWKLLAKEQLQSHIALILTQQQIDRVFIKTDKENITLAIRQ